jgi:ABC-2 type transport system ATP-binding protein
LWQFVRNLNRQGHTIVLTTHYLEEAQELCGRIAMLKGGRLIALDHTRNLLRRVAGLRMAMRVTGELPAQVAAHAVERSGDHVVLRLAGTGDVEAMLAALRGAGCAIEDLEVGHADLEDVFLQLMNESDERIAA